MKRLLFVVAFTLACQIPEAAPAKPALTEIQKLRIQNVLQRVQIAQQQVQMASVELERARIEAQSTLQPLVVKDWQLNLETLTYTPIRAEKRK